MRRRTFFFIRNLFQSTRSYIKCNTQVIRKVVTNYSIITIVGITPTNFYDCYYCWDCFSGFFFLQQHAPPTANLFCNEIRNYPEKLSKIDFIWRLAWPYCQVCWIGRLNFSCDLFVDNSFWIIIFWKIYYSGPFVVDNN